MEIVLPSDYIYKRSRLDFNHSISKYPKFIFYCASFKDVKNAILYGKCNNLKIRIRSGGHNYEDFCNENNALIIDISNLNKIEINKKENSIYIEAGASLGNIYTILGADNIPFPGGSCPTVSISGLTLGGGWGYSSRKFGLTCDNVIEISMIDYNGNLITCNKDTNSNLFFALRGAGGGNFGVVVSFKFALPKPTGNITEFTLTYRNISHREGCIFFKIWQDFIQTAPNDLNMKCSLSKTATLNEVNISCTGLFYGEKEDLLKILSPFKFTSKHSLTTVYTSFLQAILIIGSTYPQYETFFSYARFVDRNFTDLEISTVINILFSPLPTDSQEIFINFYGLGGKVKDTTNTAFFYRNSNYILLIETLFSNKIYSLENRNWIYTHSKLINPITNGSYINFPYSPFPNYLYNYYGPNVYKLKCIKSHYDPLNIFNFQQGLN